MVIDPLRREQEMDLWSKWKAGDRSSLQPLVNSMKPIREMWVNNVRNSGLPDSILRAEATQIMIRQFETYNPTFGASLSTHVQNAGKKINRAVFELQDVGRMPEARKLKVFTFTDVRDQMAQKLGRPPSTHELADELGWPKREVERMQSELRRDISLTQELEDLPVQAGAEIRNAVEFAFYDLPGEEQVILEHLLGLHGKPQMTGAQIAQMLGKSEAAISAARTRIQQKVDGAL